MNRWAFWVSLAAWVRLGLELGLTSRQLRWLQEQEGRREGSGADPLTVRKSFEYSRDRLRLATARRAYSTLLFLGWTVWGGLGFLHRLLDPLALDPTLQGTLFLILFGFAQGLFQLPWTVYETFGLEARYGFNRTGWGLFLLDRCKESLLFIALGFPFSFAVLWVLEKSPAGWVWLWILYCGFSLFLRWAYPVWIAPLFHRFRPLEKEWALRIQKLLGEHGIGPCTLWVIDASRRSGHSNAYFAGVGRHRRVVLYDTLLEQLSPEEAEAVLLHEIGHYMLRHERLLTVVEVLGTFGCSALLPWWYRQTSLFYSFGFPGPSYEALLALFSLVLPTILFPLQPVFTWVLRFLERQADAFVVRYGRGGELACALQKIYGENALLFPTEPLYAAFYCTHPPPEDRLRSLAKP